MSHPRDVALITGGARRVGRAIALELARAGFDVAVHCRTSVDDARQTVAAVESLGRRSILLQADLTDPATPADLIRRTVEALGGLRVLVNNASIWEPGTLAEMTRESWHAHIETNLTAPAMLAQAAWPHLRRGSPGHVINLCDVAADRPWTDYIAYCVSKGGLVTLTRALARAMAPDVCVNGISPGVVMLPDDCDEEARRTALARVPMKRQGRPEDVAAVVRFLVQDGAYITGQILNVDGGRSIA